MKLTLACRPVVVAALLLSGIAACRAKPEVVRQRAFENGERLYAAGKYPDATLEYQKALQQDPKFGPARFKLAEAYAASGNLRAAYPEYLRAADLLPGDLDVQVKAGNMLLLGRRFQEAKDKARAILTSDPNHLAGLLLLGNALAGLRDLDNAAAVTERATDIDPERAGVYANLGTLHLARGDREEAEKAFALAVQRNPADVSGWLAQGNFLRAVGELDRAEASFKRAVEVAPAHPRANRVLAAYYLDTNRPDRAEPFLRFVAESQKDDGSWMDLADFYLSAKRFDDARQVLKGLLDRKPSFEARSRMALVAHAEGKVDEAHGILNDILKADPNNAAAQALQARVLLRENKPDDALLSARGALQADPQSAEAHFMLGLVHVSRNSLEDARKAFLQVLAINPTAADAKIELAKLHTSRRELDTAIGFARETVATQPENLKARLVLARSLMVRPEDHRRARAVLDELLSKYPSSAAVHTSLGEFYLSTGQRETARKQFERALELDPSFVEALTSLMSMDLSSGKARAAWNRFRARLTKAPTDPDLLLIGAKFAATVRDLNASEQFLRRLVAVEPSSMEAYAMLGQLFVSQGRLADALKEFQEVARRDPKSVAAHTMLGLLMHRLGHLEEAAGHYQKAVNVDQGAVTAANNLAWLYAEKGEKLDVALQLATSAKARAPSSAEVSDTLGWVYFKKGMWPLAITAFEQSVEGEARNPRYHYHLGLAFAKSGEDAKARRALQQALALQPGFAGAEDAKQVLATLVY
jgi:putative PEP-CTERM system TPR-repeat lipoprotein